MFLCVRIITWCLLFPIASHGTDIPIKKEINKTLAVDTTHKTVHPKKNHNSDSGDVIDVKAPMPGRVIEVFTKQGDFVLAGQPLLMMEAMKMQMMLCAPRDGYVNGLTLIAGDTISGNSLLLNLSNTLNVKKDVHEITQNSEKKAEPVVQVLVEEKTSAGQLIEPFPHKESKKIEKQEPILQEVDPVQENHRTYSAHHQKPLFLVEEEALIEHSSTSSENDNSYATVTLPSDPKPPFEQKVTEDSIADVMVTPLKGYDLSSESQNNPNGYVIASVSSNNPTHSTRKEDFFDETFSFQHPIRQNSTHPHSQQDEKLIRYQGPMSGILTMLTQMRTYGDDISVLPNSLKTPVTNLLIQSIVAIETFQNLPDEEVQHWVQQHIVPQPLIDKEIATRSFPITWRQWKPILENMFGFFLIGLTSLGFAKLLKPIGHLALKGI